MKSEDRVKNALNVLDSMCDKEKSLVNKFIVGDMSKSLRASFQDMQRTMDSMDAHTAEQQSDIKELADALDGLMVSIGGGVKKCGHDFTCNCAWTNAKKAANKHLKKGE